MKTIKLQPWPHRELLLLISVLCSLPSDAFPPGALIVSLDPIFRYLRDRGCTMEGEYVTIGGWPVQFLPPAGLLIEEALESAVDLDVEGIPVRVFTADRQK
jgi:hypothetical protein